MVVTKDRVIAKQQGGCNRRQSGIETCVYQKTVGNDIARYTRKWLRER